MLEMSALDKSKASVGHISASMSNQLRWRTLLKYQTNGQIAYLLLLSFGVSQAITITAEAIATIQMRRNGINH